MQVKNLKKKIAGFPFIKQTGMMECGTTCLAMIFKYYGYYDIRRFLSEKAEVNTEGIDLYTLSELGESFGFETDGYQLDYDHLQKVVLPCIAHYEGNHFVVVYKIDSCHIWVADPAVGKYKLTRKEFEAKWNGIVLVLNPTDVIFRHNEMTELVEKTRSKQKDIFTRFYLSSVSTSKRILLQILVATLLLQVLGLALPLFTQTIIDQVLVNENIKLLYAILGGMVLVFSCHSLLMYGRNMLITQFKVTFERNFFSKFFDHFIRLRQSYFDLHKREDFINRFQENMKIRQALNPSILEGIIDFFFIASYLLVLFFYSSLLAMVSLSVVLVFLILVAIFTPRLRNLEGRIFAENVKTMGSFLDTLLGVQTVRLLGIEKLKFWKWKNQYTRALNKVLIAEKTYVALSTALNSVFFAGQIVVYWLGAWLTFQGELTIGAYIAFITIFTIIMNALNRVMRLWYIFTELSVTFDKLNDVLVQDIRDRGIENKRLVKTPVHIRFETLNFKYRRQEEKNTLQDINLEIPAGSFTGMVGRNGSGKSTLIKLLCNLYEQYEGKIMLNDTELRQVNPTQLRNIMGVIPQDVFLFDGTVKENILYGRLSATDEEVVEAATLADLHPFIKEQFLGYNMKIGENGVKLSGGQKLKIAFARLFIANPEIIILDEASSALDVSTEKKIMDNLRRKFSGKTIISIAHRLHSLRHADQIVVLEEGRLAESGTHLSLLEKEGVYKEFIDTYINF